MFNGMNGLEILKNWPRYDTGEPLRFGDEVEHKEQGHRFTVDVIEFMADGWRACSEKDAVRDVYRPGERVNRPAKVLDADGVEIREKCDVWWICEGDERGVHAERLRVETIYPNGLVECSPYNGGTWVSLEPSELYVNKPVPASDGKPLREGETVWDTNGDELVIGALEDGGHTVTCRYADVGDGIPVHGMWSPSQLTHERPDSWERLEEDLGDEMAKQQCGPISPELACKLAGEFVRRCRALAERERGE